MTNRSARDEIMTSIRSGLEKFDATPEPVPQAAAARTETPDRESLIESFRCFAAEEAATSERIDSSAGVPRAVVQYLNEQALPLEVLVAGQIIPGGLDWSLTGELEIVDRPIRPDGDTVVTGCFAGLAESGAIVTVSSPDCPNELQFLAATHIVVVPAGRIFADYESFWHIVGEEFATGMPRSMSWIVGPSRTADLGVPSRLGAHGPSRLHLLIVDE
jgi:L-lactate dehydrogenase complex protein LldG